MSFSGLKTAVIRLRDKIVLDNGTLSTEKLQDLCASFQQAVSDVLLKKTEFAMMSFSNRIGFFPKSFAVAGGVAANSEIRLKLQNLCEEKNVIFSAPPINLCTDNGAMIAWAGIELLKAGRVDDMSLKAKPRWPLDVISPPMLGSGKKGAKA